VYSTKLRTTIRLHTHRFGGPCVGGGLQMPRLRGRRRVKRAVSRSCATSVSQNSNHRWNLGLRRYRYRSALGSGNLSIKENNPVKNLYHQHRLRHVIYMGRGYRKRAPPATRVDDEWAVRGGTWSMFRKRARCIAARGGVWKRTRLEIELRLGSDSSDPPDLSSSERVGWGKDMYTCRVKNTLPRRRRAA